MIDPFELAMLDKSKPLKIRQPTRSTTCAIAGCPIDEHTGGVVSLPDRKGTACLGCATDHGFTVRD